jgi:hypothetical protein
LHLQVESKVAVIPHKDHKRFLVTGIGDDEGFVP